MWPDGRNKSDKIGCKCFGRSAEGRVIKCLTIVDDATHESIAIVPARNLSGTHVTRILGKLAMTRQAPSGDSD